MIALVLVAIGLGVVLPLQAGINAQLRTALGTPLAAAFLSFLIGTVALALGVVLTRTPLPLAARLTVTPWWFWVGGLLGVVYVFGTIVLAPRLGAAALVASIVAGQMLASLLLDHFGWVGYPVQPVSVGRVLGAALVVLGVILVQR